MKEKIVLFEDKKDCCGCGACMNKCPKGAITMQEDEAGFLYPYIDEAICVGCGACVASCGFKKPNVYDGNQQKVYAFSSKDSEILIKSASGGAFAEIAKKHLSQENVAVYGAASSNRDDGWKVKHIRIDNAAELDKLQGSKYVQSEIGTAYSDVKKDLLAGVKVLFSGTPCQVDGLRSFLGKEYDNLITVDIICHGVPSHKMYSDFLRYRETGIKGKIARFAFRDKSKGQGMISRMDVVSDSGKEYSIIKKGELYSYFYLFLKQHIYRINCYSCPYARKERVSDITLGDFWGFAGLYPEAENEHGLTPKAGVSCLLANTSKGLDVVNQLRDNCVLMESDFEKAAAFNGQLKHPSELSPIRDKVIGEYSKSGFVAVEKYYNTHFLKDRFKYGVSAIMPMEFKRKLHKITGK